jgi:hypothetical protein
MLKDNQLSTVLLLVALGFLIYYLTRPKVVSEGFADEEVATEATPELPEVQPDVLQQIVNETVAPQTQEVNGNQNDVFQFEPSDLQDTGASLDAAFERPIPQEARPDVVDMNKNNVSNYNAKDFLPNEINDEWFDTDFSQAKYNMNDDKLINTERYVVGVNTVGQSLKNASYDIRGTIPNPKFSVSPWNNSTYEPDFNLKPLC